MIRVNVQLADSDAQTSYELTEAGFEVGRARAAGPVPRCVLTTDPYVSRNHLRLEPSGPATFRASNLSSSQPVLLANGDPLKPGESRMLPVPAELIVGRSAIRVDVASFAGSADTFVAVPRVSRRPLSEAREPLELAGWFEAVVSLHRAAAGTDGFYQQTAQALVDLIGLDVGLVLLRRPAGWAVVARAARADAGAARGREFSLSILRKLEADRETLRGEDVSVDEAESLREVESLVASPVLGAGDAVIGAIYGTRWATFRPGQTAIGPLEAQMVRVLATAMSASLIRAEQEAEATRLRVQFRQYFSDQLARDLEGDPSMLEGQDREASFLFADIVGFSTFSESLGPRDTFKLVNAVMETLTEAVHAHEGVVMDYVGDELIALWNAPVDVPEHPRHAAECARGLNAALAAVNKTWEPRLGRPVRVSVGVNTGTARVGNTGTRYKFKYGALGHTVNVASRIQGATKAFGVPILLAGATRAQLPEAAPARRLGCAQVVGVKETVEVYELAAAATPEWLQLRDDYGAALALFEAGDGEAAGAAAAELLATPHGKGDGPTLLLASQVTDRQVNRIEGPGVFRLRAK